MNETQQELLNMINSESFKKALSESVDKMIKKQDVVKSNRIIRVYNDFDNTITDIIDKIILKYNSEKYYFKETNMSYEPRTKLYWMLREYFIKYGRECSEEEYEKYGNIFTRDMYYYKGYIAHVMDGQGSIINVFKSE